MEAEIELEAEDRSIVEMPGRHRNGRSGRSEVFLKL